MARTWRWLPRSPSSRTFQVRPSWARCGFLATGIGPAPSTRGFVAGIFGRRGTASFGTREDTFVVARALCGSRAAGLPPGIGLPTGTGTIVDPTTGVLAIVALPMVGLILAGPIGEGPMREGPGIKTPMGRRTMGLTRPPRETEARASREHAGAPRALRVLRACPVHPRRRKRIVAHRQPTDVRQGSGPQECKRAHLTWTLRWL
jgi:hypothetical protein